MPSLCAFGAHHQTYDDVIKRVPPHYLRSPQSRKVVSEAIFDVFEVIAQAEQLAVEISRPFFL